MYITQGNAYDTKLSAKRNIHNCIYGMVLTMLKFCTEKVEGNKSKCYL